MAYILEISVFGDGNDPNHRSHWGFLIHRAGDQRGELLHVKLLDHKTLRYQFEEKDTAIVSLSSEGRWTVTSLSPEKRLKAKEVIRKTPAPADGKRRCQDWVLEVCMDLEVEELIPAGFSETCSKCIGLPARSLAAKIGDGWTDATR